MKTLISLDGVQQIILLLRGQKVIVDHDLAILYGVPTKRLNEQVQRNRKRFPSDFMIQLTNQEVIRLKSQFATSNVGRGGRRKLPYAFTEHGVAMLSSVLNSDRAIEVNIAIMRAFTQLRALLLGHQELARKLAELEEQYDSQFHIVFDAIRKLMEPAALPPKRRIGFAVGVQNE